MKSSSQKKSENWGGARSGAGAKRKWKLGLAKALSIPVDIHPEVIRYAKLLDGRLEECVVAEVLSCHLKQLEAAPRFSEAREQELEAAISLAIEGLSEIEKMDKKAETPIQEKVKEALEILRSTLEASNNLNH